MQTIKAEALRQFTSDSVVARKHSNNVADALVAMVTPYPPVLPGLLVGSDICS